MEDRWVLNKLERFEIEEQAQAVIDRWSFSDEKIKLNWQHSDIAWATTLYSKGAKDNIYEILLSECMLEELDTLEEVKHIMLHEMAHVRHIRRTGASDHSQEFWDIARKEMGCKELWELERC